MKLALVVAPMAEGRRVTSDLQEELEARPHLGSPRVSWDELAQHVIVEVIDADLDAGRAGEAMAEELIEVASAVIADFDMMHVEILAVADA